MKLSKQEKALIDMFRDGADICAYFYKCPDTAHCEARVAPLVEIGAKTKVYQSAETMWLGASVEHIRVAAFLEDKKPAAGATATDSDK
ncbi:hypothetical protein [Lacticaseibacillus hulanensis]|uniref:hypothetical protein n=1 Tax=Lacticaseibacillus hulanensis TaxID=2493111 RepID=UPI000FDB6421|nr:hypothetical protein [Lacticaseibacillus hulanensis]